MSSSRQSRDEERPETAPTSHQVETLCRTALEGLVLVDDARRYVRLNEPAAKLLGAPVEDVLKGRLGDFTPPEGLPALERMWADFARHGAVHGPWEVLRGDGSRVLVQYRGTRNFGPGQHLIAARIAPPQVHVAGVRAAVRQATLTARERQVLQLAADGHSTRKIAELLHLRPSTIKTHFEHVYDKLGTHDRVSAVAECLRGGLIE
jgi:DNA-binding CsgD family transcriptional regulator